mmetsp:Transcript_1170/g.1169  ORF Transcript_1170/g.1169 Transcript_1170/m.1169 type:complete len:89 (-) Transcript_1170:1457-1723(-)
MSASVEYLTGEMYWIHLSQTYTSLRFTKYPAKIINGIIIVEVIAVAAEAFVTDQPTNNAKDVAQNTFMMRITTNKKNFPACTVSPTAK